MSETKLITPEAVLSYPHLFKPQAATPDADPKYSCTLIFEGGTDLTPLQAAVKAAFVKKFSESEWKKHLAAVKDGKKSRYRLPFRLSDDEPDKGYPKGSVFMNVRTDTQPVIVSRYAGQDGRPTVIDDPKQVYAGCRVRASVNAYGYDTAGNKGVTFGLNNLQKLADGDRLDGRTDAQDEFDALETEPADPWSDVMPKAGSNDEQAELDAMFG